MSYSFIYYPQLYHKPIFVFQAPACRSYCQTNVTLKLNVERRQRRAKHEYQNQ